MSNRRATVFGLSPGATFLVLCLLLPGTAFAYVDPGSGMLLWQGLLAAIGAVIVFVRHPWRALKEFVRRLLRR